MCRKAKGQPFKTALFFMSVSSKRAALEGQHSRHVRAMDQGRQRCDQVDAAVMPDVRRQRGPAPASCARLQSRQLPAHAGDTRADQGLVADEPEGEADQDRREGRQPRPLRRIPDGRGRYPPANVPGDFAAHRGTPATASARAGMRRSMVMRGGVRPDASKNGPISWSVAVRGARITAAVRALRLSCLNATKAQKSTPV